MSDGETYLEEMSTLSSSSTFVGPSTPSPRKRPRAKLSVSPSSKPTLSRRRASSTDYEGFSFNPLFYGDREIIVKQKGDLQVSHDLVAKPGSSPSPAPSLRRHSWKP
ncbi:hypothetical protein CC2G_008064 [Coprinopsis cinerea AmutBmut pab1-1]|nr:hypothetical protein CC2G_008064 [Coprinopsis cinerea AmutBmut pab1-1]